jgi:hypothetical protein
MTKMPAVSGFNLTMMKRGYGLRTAVEVHFYQEDPADIGM